MGLYRSDMRQLNISKSCVRACRKEHESKGRSVLRMLDCHGCSVCG